MAKTPLKIMAGDYVGNIPAHRDFDNTLNTLVDMSGQEIAVNDGAVFQGSIITIPNTGLVAGYIVHRACVLQSGLANSFFRCFVPPLASTTFVLEHSGALGVSEIGTFVFDTMGEASVSFPEDVAFERGDELRIKLPGQANGIAQVFWAIISGTGEPVTVTIAEIPNIAAPIAGEAPVTVINSMQYTGSVLWSPSHATFQTDTAYTATVTLTPKVGYTFVGIPANFFTINGITCANSAGSGVATHAFAAIARMWSAVGIGANNHVYTLQAFNNELYVGGYFISAGGTESLHVARWTGSEWLSAAYGLGGSNVKAFAEFNGALYAGGEFDDVLGAPVYNVAKWDGSTWSAIGGGISSAYSSVNAMAIYNGALYVAGYFTTAGGVSVNNIAKWNGTSWSTVSSGINGQSQALAVYNNELYAAGYFTTAGGVSVNNIAKWNGSTWSAVGAGLNSGVTALAVFNNELYVAGFFNMAGTISANHIAKWNGSVWSALGSGIPGIVKAFTIFNNNLYIGGAFDTVDGTNIASPDMAKWNGTSWSAASGGDMNDAIESLAVLNEELYAGGRFTTADGIPVNRIARLV